MKRHQTTGRMSRMDGTAEHRAPEKRKQVMQKLCGVVLVLIATLPFQVATADDLTGSSRFLCASVQATMCSMDGECTIDLPWNLNIPQFIEVDLEGRRLATTTASGLNRVTPIDHLARSEGTIVLHGFEMDRAFSWVITEQTGQVTVAVALEGLAVTVFGACTPLDDAKTEATP